MRGTLTAPDGPCLVRRREFLGMAPAALMSAALVACAKSSPPGAVGAPGATTTSPPAPGGATAQQISMEELQLALRNH